MLQPRDFLFHWKVQIISLLSMIKTMIYVCMVLILVYMVILSVVDFYIQNKSDSRQLFTHTVYYNSKSFFFILDISSHV